MPSVSATLAETLPPLMKTAAMLMTTPDDKEYKK